MNTRMIESSARLLNFPRLIVIVLMREREGVVLKPLRQDEYQFNYRAQYSPLHHYGYQLIVNPGIGLVKGNRRRGEVIEDESV